MQNHLQKGSKAAIATLHLVYETFQGRTSGLPLKITVATWYHFKSLHIVILHFLKCLDLLYEVHMH